MARNLQNLYYAVIIHGLGDADWGDSTTFGANWAEDLPVAVYAGDAQFADGTHIPLAGIPVSADGSDGSIQLGTKIDPITGVVESGAISIEIINANLDPKGELGLTPDSASTGITTRNLFKDLTRRVREAYGLLFEDMTTAQTTIKIWARNGLTLNAGEEIYLEQETIILESVASTSGNITTYNCHRGAFDSRASIHKANPAAADPPTATAGYSNRIYRFPPMFNRPVTLVEYDGTGTNEIVGRGFLQRGPSTESTLVAKVEINDAWGKIFSEALNLEPLGGDTEGQQIQFFSNGVASGGVSIRGNEQSRDFGPIIQGGNRVVLQVDQALITGAYVDERGGYTLAKEFNGLGDDISTVILGTKPPNIEGEDETNTKVYEVLAVGKKIKETGGTSYSQTSSNQILGFLLNVLLSTGRTDNGSYDLYPRNWGYAIDEKYVDVTGIEALRDDWINTEHDQLVLGWDGSQVDWRQIRASIQPHRFFCHFTNDHKITVSRLEVITVSDSPTTIPAGEIVLLSEKQTYGWDEQIQTLSGSAKQPWHEKEREIVVRDLEQGVEPWSPRPKDPAFVLNVSSVEPIDVRGNGRQRDLIQGVLEFTRRPMPVWRVRLPRFGTAGLLYPGQKVKADFSAQGYFIKQDGTRVQASDDVFFYVIEVSRSLGDADFEASLLAVNDPLLVTPKLVAPTWKVTAFSGSDITVERMSYGVDMSAYLSGVEDIEVWNPRTGVIDLYTTGTTTLGVVSGTATGASTLTFTLSTRPNYINPAVGDYVRLTNRADNSGYNNTYAYMAGTADTFSSGGRGDIYV